MTALESTSEIIALFFAFLLFILIIALIFGQKFRNAVLGGPGEATIMGIITLKGVVIVLLFGLLVGGILYALNKVPENTAASGPIPVQLNVHFEPNEVNPRHPEFKVKAYIKGQDGAVPVPCISKVQEGALSVSLDVPDMQTPFFIVFETARGVWQTDDFSVHEATATARKQVEVTFP